jgi:hypothetical protein
MRCLQWIRVPSTVARVSIRVPAVHILCCLQKWQHHVGRIKIDAMMLMVRAVEPIRCTAHRNILAKSYSKADPEAGCLALKAPIKADSQDALLYTHILFPAKE